MRARVVATLQGARWLADGWRLFRIAPIAWIAMVFAYWLLMSFASVIPVIGAAAALVLVPPFSVGFMAAARAASRGAPVEIGLLFDGFRHSLQAQLVLGAIYFVCVALVLAGSALVDGGALGRWMVGGERPEEALAAREAVLAALSVAAALYTPVMMMFWFAPPLAAWHSVSPAKALFYSFFACLLNWRAFLAYGAVTAAVTIALPLVAVSALTLLSGGALRNAAMALVFPIVVVLMPVLFASFYASYRDVFGAGD